MKKILIDIIPVLIGILLALLVNNWRQMTSERSYIDNSIRAIMLENESNIEELENSLRRQHAFLDTLRKHRTKENSLHDIVRIAKGLNTPDLKSTTWRFLIQDSKHTLVDYEFISRLAEIEKYESLIDQHQQKVLDMIYQPDFFRDPDLKEVCNLMLQDFIEVERQLVDALEEFNSFALSKGFK